MSIRSVPIFETVKRFAMHLRGTLRTLLIAVICGVLLTLSLGCAKDVEQSSNRQYYDPPVNDVDNSSVATQVDDGEVDAERTDESGGDEESRHMSTTIPEDGNNPVVDESRQEVSIGASGFEPNEIAVTAGTTIVWKNEDEENHEVHADDDAYQLDIIGQGGQVQVTFDAPGTFTYHCHVHPTVRGTIVVL